MEPQLKGVVIISLPPPGDPSKGKTITAFAIPDDPEDFQLPPTAADHQQQQRRWGEAPLPPAMASSASSGRGFSLKKAAWGVLAASLVVTSLWACLFSEAPFEFLQSSEEVDRGREAGSLLLPLFPKPGGQRLLHQGDVKLGSAGGHGRGREMEQRQVRHTAASTVASRVVNSTAAFPVRGNIFPDGYTAGCIILPFVLGILLDNTSLT